MDSPIGSDGLPVVEIEGGGAHTSILCGMFDFDRDARETLLPHLPSLIRVEGGPSSPVAWLDTTLRLLADEQTSQRPGADVIVGRLIEILFIQVLRAWILRSPHQRGWLAALSDPKLARALSLVHGEPARAWTAASLAREAGMSRSSFFTHFSTVLGETPSSYLTGWRMRLARRKLRTRDEGLAQIAVEVGYGSEAAFSRAFKRVVGMSPSHWRQSARQ